MTTDSMPERKDKADFLRLLQPINLPSNVKLNSVSSEHIKGEIQGLLVQIVQQVPSLSGYFISAQWGQLLIVSLGHT